MSAAKYNFHGPRECPSKFVKHHNRRQSHLHNDIYAGVCPSATSRCNFCSELCDLLLPTCWHGRGECFKSWRGISACSIVGNVLAWFVLNRIGRRLLFTSGVAGCTAMLVLIGVLDVIPTQFAKLAQGALCAIYAFVYILTLEAIAFVLLGEVSSLALRARTTSLTTTTQSCA